MPAAQSDRWCLDGKKLMAINGSIGGTYGQPGAEYRTEEDSYTQILSTLAPATDMAAHRALWASIPTTIGNGNIRAGIAKNVP